MVTPFNKDLKVDYDKAQKLALFLAENGSDSLVVTGTTGESPTLTADEKLNMYKAVKEVVSGLDTKVIAGTGSNCTDNAIELSKKAAKIGVDGLLLVCPYYNKPPQSGLIRHFTEIAAATDLPNIIYNVPGRSGVNISAETTIELANVENIVGTKEASGDMEQIAHIIDNTTDDFKTYSGDDATTFPILALGGDGVISVASHIAGRQMKLMTKAAEEGNWSEALALHNQLMPLFKGLFKTTNPILVKAALKLIGFDAGGLRIPLIEATDFQVEELNELLNQLNLL
jgi:4-hydroxy-tetrahydrodipicolinate synthase